MPDPSQLVQLRFAAGVLALDVLRDHVVAALSTVHQQTVSDVELVATELVTNACLHGEPPALFHLFALDDPARLRMEVFDSGPGLPRVTHPGGTEQHGRGLLLVTAMSTTWGIVPADGGKTVWAEFLIPCG